MLSQITSEHPWRLNGGMMRILSKWLSVSLALAWVVAVLLVGCSGQGPAKTISPTATSPAGAPTSMGPTKTVAPTLAGAVTPTLTATSPGETLTSTPSSYKFLRKWGSDVTSDGRLNLPTGVAVDAAGNVYVADIGNARIQKFSSEGIFLAKWGSRGQGDGQFQFDIGGERQIGAIAVDASGNVYVADSGNHRIQKFSSQGVFLAKWGSEGEGDGQFGAPVGIAVDKAGNIYVADTDNHRIQKFSSEGDFLAKWGNEGNSDGQLNSPTGIAVDAAGNVYVADLENYNIQVFAPGP